MIYLDYAATTPISEVALDVYTHVATMHFGNSSSLHDIGSNAQQLLTESRIQLASCFNGIPEGVFFTSGGSESNYLAITSLVRAHASKGSHILTTKTEHASIANTFRLLEGEGFRVTYLPVDSTGMLQIENVENAIEEDTIFASIGQVNGEIGTLQPLEEIGELLAERGILFHSDCVQTFGKIPIDVQTLRIDSLSVSSHKVYGPKGVGACYISPNITWRPNIDGTSHENGFRPGTVNVPGIASFVTAASALTESLIENREQFRRLRKILLETVQTTNRIVIEGHSKLNMPSIIGFRLKGLEGQHVMLELNQKGFAVSTGTACSVGNQSPSKTMIALGYTLDKARELVRISLGVTTTSDEVVAVGNALNEIQSQHKVKL